MNAGYQPESEVDIIVDIGVDIKFVIHFLLSHSDTLSAILQNRNLAPVSSQLEETRCSPQSFLKLLVGTQLKKDHQLLELSISMLIRLPPFLRLDPPMNLEASRFGKHAVQHIQIPEAE
ncbi:hypothetical protein DAPPUDRAFT_234006 [Daphnia pulex]|uniref:Uncharacterized protein n=1 Tax=Daphnia pulex TaxID=6669 RepID=E9FUC0_DAPPU|nr:hypothetical protein DAPPUDRAFT_234006 [Daphnia pulex]|eukprot:EFX88700.1 hypothetical protein DAPPUDRAFT_234006 [Daphnia pulex]